MLRAGKDERGKAELAHVAQALQLARLEQRNDHAFVPPLEGHEPVHWIAQNHGAVSPQMSDAWMFTTHSAPRLRSGRLAARPRPVRAPSARRPRPRARAG